MFNPYDLIKIQEMLSKNKGFLDTFFGKNPFNEGLIEKLVNQGKGIGGDETPIQDAEATSSATNNRTVPVDMIQKKSELLLIFEIPGLNGQEDVHIKIVGSTLILEGELRRHGYYSDSEVTKLERQVGRFSKKVPIPIIYDSKRIRASYNHGLLEVRLPILRQNNHENITIQFPKS